MSDINIKKVKTERELFVNEKQIKLQRNVFDPRALHHGSPMVWSAQDWLKLADATDGNCGILLYKFRGDTCSYPDINHVIREELVKIADHIEEPPSLPELAAIVNERYPEEVIDSKSKMFLSELHISHQQSHLLSQITKGQVSNETWNTLNWLNNVLKNWCCTSEN